MAHPLPMCWAGISLNNHIVYKITNGKQLTHRLGQLLIFIAPSSFTSEMPLLFLEDVFSTIACCFWDLPVCGTAGFSMLFLSSILGGLSYLNFQINQSNPLVQYLLRSPFSHHSRKSRFVHRLKIELSPRKQRAKMSFALQGRFNQIICNVPSHRPSKNHDFSFETS